VPEHVFIFGFFRRLLIELTLGINELFLRFDELLLATRSPAAATPLAEA
jgi:hypothetical protein